MTKYQNPNFNKEKYWRNRKAKLRGQMSDRMYDFITGVRERIAQQQAKWRGDGKAK